MNPYLVAHRTFGPELIPADTAWTHREGWDQVFGRTGPLHLEVGCGNGFFLAGLASRHPDWNVVGVEIRYKRVVLSAKKIRKQGLHNARVCRYHGAFLDDLFAPGRLAGLYVNHPDPWPKTRHEKNRLISAWFLEDTARLLQPGGRFRLKSDHLPNLDRVEELLNLHPDLPLRLVGRAADVTRGPAPWPDDIETNYQRKFRERGLPVGALELERT